MSLRALTRDAALIGGGLLASRLLAFVREALLARIFGLSGRMDALVVALSISDFAVNLLLGGAAATVLLPGLSLAHQRQDEAGFWALARSLLRWLFLALVAAAILIILLARVLVAWTAPGLAPATAALAVSLLRVTALSIIFAGGALAYTSILQARERFLLPSVAAVLQNATVVAVILLFARRLTAVIVAASVVVGAAGRNLVLRWGSVRQGLTGGQSWARPLPEAQAMLADFLPATIAFSIIYLNAFIDRYYASLIAPGAISALNYADKLTQVPLAVFGSAVSIAIIPIFTRHMRDGRRDRLRRDLARSLMATMALAVVIAAAIIAVRIPVIHLLFGRGTLGPEATAMAALALSFYALTIVPEIGSMILMRIFHAERNVWTPAFLTLAALVAHGVLAAIFAPRWGIRGIGVALVGSSAVYFFVIGTLVWSRLRPAGKRAQAAAGRPA